jgi:hypothetical protein
VCSSDLAEPSGLTVVDGTVYCASDDGKIGWRNADGDWLWQTLAPVDGQEYWTDLEAITGVPSQPDYLYVGVENGKYAEGGQAGEGPIVVEVAIANVRKGGGLVASENRWWPLNLVATAKNVGMEAMTFIPDGQHPFPPSTGGFGGYFYAGTKGGIEAFDLGLHLDATGQRQTGRGPIVAIRKVNLSGKFSELLNDEGDLFLLSDDEAGDKAFPSPSVDPALDNPSDAVYETDYHRPPAKGEQGLQVWRFGVDGQYYPMKFWSLPKVGCEGLTFLGRDLVIGYDQSDRQAYRNDWQCPPYGTPDADRAKLPPADVWCESYVVRKAKDDPEHAVRKPQKYFNYVRRHSDFRLRRKFEVRWVEAESVVIPWASKSGLPADRSLRISRPKRLPDGFVWLGQVVEAAPFAAAPLVPVFRWRGEGASPYVGVGASRYLWNDRGSGGPKNIRVWELSPSVPSERQAQYAALGVYFEEIGSSDPGVGGYGNLPPSTLPAGLSAIHRDFLRAGEASEIWKSDGIGAHGQEAFKHPKHQTPTIPDWAEITLYRPSPWPYEPLPRTAVAAEGTSPASIPQSWSLMLGDLYR